MHISSILITKIYSVQFLITTKENKRKTERKRKREIDIMIMVCIISGLCNKFIYQLHILYAELF